MNPLHDEILTRFASRLACSYSAHYGPESAPYAPAASSLPSVMSSSAGVSQQAQGARSACTLPCLSHRTSRRGRRSAGLRHAVPGVGVAAPDGGDDAVSTTSTITMTVDGSRASRDAAQAHLLSRALHFGRNSLPLAPAMLLRNFLTSFGHMIESELCRAMGNLIELSERSAEDGAPAESRDQASRDATSERAAKAKKAVSTFGNCHTSPVVPVSCSIEYQTGLAEDFVSLDHGYCEDDTGKEVFSLPLSMNVDIEFAILDDHNLSANLSAPGTITGAFSHGRNRPDSIDVTLDTTELLRLMRKAGRRVVRDALFTAGYDVSLRRHIPPRPAHYNQGERTKGKGHTNLNNFGTFDETSLMSGQMQRLNRIDEQNASEMRRAQSSPDVQGLLATFLAGEC